MKFIKYLWEYRYLSLAIILLTALILICDFIAPYLTSNIIDVGIIQLGFSGGEKTYDECLAYLFQMAGLMLLLTIVSLGLGISKSYLSSLLGQKIGRKKRSQVYSAIMNLKQKDIDRLTKSSLITRTVFDVRVLTTMCILILDSIICTPIGAIVGLWFAINTAPSLVWIALLGILVILVGTVIIYNWAKPKFIVLQGMLDWMTAVTRRLFSGSLVYRVFNNQKIEVDNFEEANNALYKRKIQVQYLIACINPIVGLGYAGMTILILALGTLDAQNGLVQVGQMIAFIQYANMIMGSFVSVAMLIGSLPSTSVSASRVEEVISLGKTKDVKHTHNIDCINSVVFDNVSFNYHGCTKPAIKNLSCKFEKGKSYALIGTTGSGKSTMLKLIMRLYEVNDGKITANNVDFSTLDPENIRKCISYAGQDSFLFEGSVKDNIGFSLSESDDCSQIEQLARECNLDDLIGNKTCDSIKVEQSGNNISGGQKQRVSIARALAKPSDLYIFDDCFSALDASTENKIIQTIKNRTKNKTAIIVTQKIAKAKDVDEILVFDDGLLVGTGRHDELINNCSEYIEIWKSQNSNE